MIITRKHYDYLFKLAFHDIATGFYNRNWFETNIIESKQDYNISLAIVDINNLKLVNDENGHTAGDILIKTIGDKLAKYSTVVRWGGDEFFCIIKPGEEALFEEVCKNQKDFAYAIGYNFSVKQAKDMIDKLDREMYDCKYVQKNID